MEERVICLKDVTICHSKGRRGGNSSDAVLTNVNFEAHKGELLYLIGKIGSGKSSLLRSLYGETSITEGEAQVAGYNMRRLPSRQIPRLRRRLGIVFQDFQLLPDRNLYDNLLFVLKATGWRRKEEMNARIKQVLEIINLEHKAYKFPHHLSRGEQQRLAIGRALINSPEIILADEPTGNLDMSATEEVMTLFKNIISMGTCVIFATHDIGIIEHNPSRTYAFETGKIFEVDIDNSFD